MDVLFKPLWCLYRSVFFGLYSSVCISTHILEHNIIGGDCVGFLV